MKKQRQTSRTGPIQLSANKKSHSISLKSKQEPLFAPYKIDWKNPSNDNVLFGANHSVPMKEPFKNIENSATNSPFGSGLNSNTNSKIFYKNMKSELMNIKQDVEKLILKEKKTSIVSVEQSAAGNEHNPLTDHNNNGCIKTISIKNKCQQKPIKPEISFDNVQKVLASKISDNGSVSSKFTIGESKNDNFMMNNLIEDQVKNSSNIESKYRSEKDANYIRAKSKSIAESFSKGFALDLLNARQETKDNNKISIASSLKYLQNEESQSNEEHYTERSEQVRPKMEVEIKLPSFEKAKSDQVHEEKGQEQKNKLIEKLQSELKDLEKELSLRDQLMSRKEQSKFQLTEEIDKIKKEYHAERQAGRQKSGKYEEQIINLRHLCSEKENRAKFYEDELQKAIYAIRQKEQETFNLIENSNIQANTIQELKNQCERLNAQMDEIKQTFEESKGIKEKMKLKDNQIYIYQEELKEAKSKIKELKGSLSTPSKQSGFSLKPTEDQMKSSEEVSKLSWELKENKKLVENFKTENQRLKKEFHTLNTVNSENQSKIAQLVKQNSQLRANIHDLEKDSHNAVQNLLNSSDPQSVGNQISKKLSQMVDENYSLKNKISRLESSLEELGLKNNSMNEELEIYREKAESFKDCRRRLKVEDWDNLTEERDILKNELESVKVLLEETKEFYELQTMRNENRIHELKQKIEQMMEMEEQNEQNFHPNVRSVKHIKNLDVLLSEFKEMIEYNLELKNEIESTRR